MVRGADLLVIENALYPPKEIDTAGKMPNMIPRAWAEVVPEHRGRSNP